jgi:hypothetical protein
MTLAERHRATLEQGSVIAPEVVEERGYRTATSKRELVDLGFKPSQARTPGLLLPLRPPDGSTGLHVYRPDLARIVRGKELKYEYPAGEGMRIDVPPRCQAALADPSIELWGTEGQKKVDSLASAGFTSFCLLGVWNFKGKNAFGGVTLLADFDLIAWNGRMVRLVFDSDIAQKKEVRQALDRLAEHLKRKGATVTPVYLPHGPNGEKLGVDDFLREYSADELRRLADGSKVPPSMPGPTIELLDESPPAITRPLALVGDHAYATTWLHVKTTTTMSTDDQGRVVNLNPPVIAVERRCFIVRDDGRVFGPGGDQSLEALASAEDGVDNKAMAEGEPVRDGRSWRAPGVKRYRAGRRVEPAELFARLVQAYDYFLSFERSIASQTEMAELSSCLSLMTWLADAFDVLPYPWPNGERDDAEILADPRRADQNLRALMLTGNRRGAHVALKELVGKAWVTRWVPAYCPRAFTAIRLPDPVLASRALIIPLVRSGDSIRANRDPERLAGWPCDYRLLVDDLWSFGLQFLPAAAEVWADLEQETELIGRDFEVWRAPLAVARLLDRHGVVGLEERVRGVMRRYRLEKAELLDTDWTVLVIRAVHAVVSADRDSSAGHDGSAGKSGTCQFSATRILEAIQAIAAQEERNAEWASAERVGRLLARLRLKSGRTAGRRWYACSLTDAEALLAAYGVPVDENDEDEQPTPAEPTGTTVTAGTTGTESSRPGAEREVFDL